VVGASVSGLFLRLIGVLNLIAPIGIARFWRRRASADPAELDDWLDKRGFFNRLLQPAAAAAAGIDPTPGADVPGGAAVRRRFRHRHRGRLAGAGRHGRGGRSALVRDSGAAAALHGRDDPVRHDRRRVHDGGLPAGVRAAGAPDVLQPDDHRVDEERDRYYEAVLIGGREPVAITVVDYDDRWPRHFVRIAEQIRRALGRKALTIEHIGSTAVPGLPAKPIIDVLLTVAEVHDETAYVPELESIGFAMRVREPEHRMLRTPARNVHLHVYEANRPEVRNYLELRDWLRVDADDRARYAAEKRHLAQRQWRDMNDYADAKTEVINDILTSARAWRRRQAT
jgi:GrpB-like predicted nucleotidyltransferase (UPF0157 family)